MAKKVKTKSKAESTKPPGFIEIETVNWRKVGPTHYCGTTVYVMDHREVKDENLIRKESS